MIPFLHSTFIKTRFLFIFFLVFISTSVFAQVKFYTICPEKKIGKNELLQIQFKLENAAHVESFTPPSFKGFRVVSGPNQQSGMSNINGKIDRYVAVSFLLKPNAPGKYSIGSAIIYADRKKFTSEPVNIEVMNSNSSNSQAPPPRRHPLQSPFANLNLPRQPSTHQFEDFILKPGENSAEKIKKNLFVKLNVSKTECFVGEAITASYKLYTRLQSESTITEAPSFNGFSVNDLKINNHLNIEKLEGRKYNVYTLRKVQLYPMHAGNIILDPVVTENKVTFLKSDYAGMQYGNLFFKMLENFADANSPAYAVVEKEVTLKSKPVTIHVKPLPSKNVPQNYRGAVGDFKIEGSLKKDTITTDDAGNLTITISGQGNIELINAPKIIWPDGIIGFEAKVKDDIDKTVAPMKGHKVFTFPFTVSKPGDYTIDSISFSFFNPTTSSYKTIRAPEMKLVVNKGKGFLKQMAASNEPSETDKPLLSFQTLEYMGGIVLLAGMIIVAIWLRNKNRNTKENLEKNLALDEIKAKGKEKEPDFIIPEDPLLTAHEKLKEGNQQHFYQVLDVSLKKYLAGKFKLPVEEMTKKRLNEELDKCNVGLGTSLMLCSLLEEIEQNLYAGTPGSTTQINSVFEKASQVVSLLDKQVC